MAERTSGRDHVIDLRLAWLHGEKLHAANDAPVSDPAANQPLQPLSGRADAQRLNGGQPQAGDAP